MIDMSLKGIPRSDTRRSRPVKARCFRRIGFCVAGGILLQAASGGCSQMLSGLANTLGQDVVSGAGAGLSNLAQALVLNLFI